MSSIGNIKNIFQQEILLKLVWSLGRHQDPYFHAASGKLGCTRRKVWVQLEESGVAVKKVGALFLNDLCERIQRA